MAGMFFSLKEAAAKLNKTEQEVKDLAKQGKLREFRDGPNLLFKIDEVEALMDETRVMAYKEEPEEPSETPETEMTFEPEEVNVSEQQIEAEEQTEEEAEEESAAEEEILLAPETGSAPAAEESDLTGGDTALTGEGVSILGETDHDYQLTDDTMAETTIAPGTGGTEGMGGTTGEASLEELEEDVSLDSLGSGSGLLDLSLQADDTSLGGILDEIYTAEGGEEGQEPAEHAAPAAEVDITPEGESAASEIPEEELITPAMSAAREAPIMAQSYIEAPPDALCDSLGIMLFLPLLALIYAGIVTIAALKGVMPSILEKIKTPYTGMYLMAGFLLTALLAFGASFMLTGGLGTAGTKEKKLIKEKKPKKEKKAKKGKKAPPQESAE